MIKISRVVSRNVLPGTAVDSATRAAVDSITRVLAAELGPRRIPINAINAAHPVRRSG